MREWLETPQRPTKCQVDAGGRFLSFTIKTCKLRHKSITPCQEWLDAYRVSLNTVTEVCQINLHTGFRLAKDANLL